MINLEIPKKFKPLASQANQVATEVFRPISRKYDEAEHSYPKELDMLASLIDGMNEGSDIGGAGAAGVRRESNGDGDAGNRNGSNLSTVLGIIELCWGDVGLLLSMPRQGLGNSAIASVASDEQLERYGGKWAAMAITEPEAGSDSAAIRTTAELDGDEYVLNGEKIFVTSGDRADLIVVWATLDRTSRTGGDQVVHRRARQPRPEAGPARAQARHPRLRHRQLHPAGLPGAEGGAARQPRDRHQGRASAARCRRSTTRGRWSRRWRSASPAPRWRRRASGSRRPASRSTTTRRRSPSPPPRPATSRWSPTTRRRCLLTLQAAWMADNGKPNSLQASMAKAKAGRTCVDVALGCVELCGSVGYGENELLEKWARDAKILDIFEGTQQIQLLIVARQLLGKSSSELR